MYLSFLPNAGANVTQTIHVTFIKFYQKRPGNMKKKILLLKSYSRLLSYIT